MTAYLAAQKYVVKHHTKQTIPIVPSPPPTIPSLAKHTTYVDSMVFIFIASLWWLRGMILTLERGVIIFSPRERG